MKVGDLVRHITGDIGIIERIDHDHYSPREATFAEEMRRPDSNLAYYGENVDRILVLFSKDGELVQSYCPQNALEAINASR
jgi:hypothetical protein